MPTHCAITAVMHEHYTEVGSGCYQRGDDATAHRNAIHVLLLGGIIYCPLILPLSSFSVITP